MNNQMEPLNFVKITITGVMPVIVLGFTPISKINERLIEDWINNEILVLKRDTANC